MLIVIGVLLLLALVLLPAQWVRHVLRKYREPADRYPGSGAQLARHLLDLHDLHAVKVETTDQGDHYDPVTRVVRLSPEHHDGRSLAAITVAAHEVGHALQHASDYPPLRWRTRLVRLAAPAEKLGAGILMLAPLALVLTRALPVGLLMVVGGLLTLGGSLLVHLVTLPTEIDASFGRALPLLAAGDFLRPGDEPHARTLLRAAALTYVASSLVSLLSIGRWWAILRR